MAARTRLRERRMINCRAEPRGAPIEIIRLALTLTLEGVGFNAAARISGNIVNVWIKYLLFLSICYVIRFFYTQGN